MRRVWAILVTASLSLAALGGCGNSYEIRMNKTLEDMRYRKLLDDNLMPPASKGKLEELLIFVRPPKSLQPAKEFLLPQPVPGKFDAETSFLEAKSSGGASASNDDPNAGEAPRPRTTVRQSLHIVARVKRPKNPNSKKAEPTNRGEFNRDVLALLTAAYALPNELTIDKFKETRKKNNTFKQFSFAISGRNIQVYLFGPKGDPYEVALVFEYPSSELTTLFPKIELCLESFGTGNRAKRAFTGVFGDEPATPGSEPTTGAF